MTTSLTEAVDTMLLTLHCADGEEIITTINDVELSEKKH